MFRRVLVLLMLSIVALGTVASAASSSPFSVNYKVEGLTQPADLAVADPVTTGITALDLTRGPGINKATLTNGFSADGWDRAQSRDAAFAVGAYYQFGFTVQPGFTASLATLDMALRRSGATAPTNMELLVSFDGFKTNGDLIAAFNYYGRVSGTAPSPDPLPDNPFLYMKADLPGRANATTSVGDPIPTIDLTKNAALQNIPEGTVVTFRLYAWGDDKTTNTNTLALGRMVGPKIEGTVSPK